MLRLNPRALGLSLGVLGGLCLFVWTLVTSFTGYAYPILDLFTYIYPGFGISVAGSFAGLFYGFLDGFIGGYIIAWLYNSFCKEQKI
jgi:hypothetical protein